MSAPHIRKRLPRAGGNQFYKARPTADSAVLTFCGAEPTTLDLSWKDGKTKWAQENACPACVSSYKSTNDVPTYTDTKENGR